MSKLDKVGFHLIENGEIIEREIVSALEKEEHINNIKNLYDKYNKNPNTLSLEEIIKLRKLKNMPSNEEIKLDFTEDGFFICKRDLDLVLQLDDYTKAFYTLYPIR